MGNVIRDEKNHRCKMMRFHDRHGTHVKLSTSKTSATRFKSFANAVVFSHRPLAFGETFLFEIEEQEKDWSGHVRCGITTHNPQTMKSVPPYLLPDMAQMGRTWVFAIKSTMQKPLGDEHFKDYGCHNYKRQAAGDKDNNPKFCGKKAQEGELKPTDVGSRIGVKVSPTGELYFFVNGMKFGPCALDVPVDKDLYVAVDVYGTTKRVQIIQCGGIQGFYEIKLPQGRVGEAKGYSLLYHAIENTANQNSRKLLCIRWYST